MGMAEASEGDTHTHAQTAVLLQGICPAVGRGVGRSTLGRAYLGSGSRGVKCRPNPHPGSYGQGLILKVRSAKQESGSHTCSQVQQKKQVLGWLSREMFL